MCVAALQMILILISIDDIVCPEKGYSSFLKVVLARGEVRKKELFQVELKSFGRKWAENIMSLAYKIRS